MTKSKLLTSTETRSIRAENIPGIFNMELAMQALNDTPAKVRSSGALGPVCDAIVNCIVSAGRPLAINQIVAMLTAGGLSVTSKMISDKCWSLAGNTTNKDEAVKKAKFEARKIESAGRGMYGPRA